MNKILFWILSVIIVASGFFVAMLDYQLEYVFISTVFMIALCIPSYYFFIKSFKKKNVPIIILVLLSIFSMIIESVGVMTGFPYGVFNYTDKLGFFVGVIPWTVSFGWVPLVIGSWFLVEYYEKKQNFLRGKESKIISVLKKAFLGAIILMIFDLVLDPGSVSVNFWEWPLGGFYYGVPLSNFLGWIFSGFIGMLMIYVFAGKQDFVLDKNILFTAFYGNLFWTMIVIVNGMLVPSIIGIILTLFLAKKFLLNSSYKRKIYKSQVLHNKKS